MPQTERDIAGRQPQVSDAKLRKIMSEQARPTIVIILWKTAEEEEARAKATAKADLLDRLGITEDEAKLLLS